MRKFLELPLEQQVTRIIIGAVVVSAIVGGLTVFKWFSIEAVIGFVALSIVCIPIGILHGKMKSAAKNAIFNKEDDDDGDYA